MTVPLAIVDGEEVPPDPGTAANVRGPTHSAADLCSPPTTPPLSRHTAPWPESSVGPILQSARSMKTRRSHRLGRTASARCWGGNLSPLGPPTKLREDVDLAYVGAKQLAARDVQLCPHLMKTGSLECIAACLPEERQISDEWTFGRYLDGCSLRAKPQRRPIQSHASVRIPNHDPEPFVPRIDFRRDHCF